MINVLITKDGSGFSKIEVSGHSGYDIEGRDIVCASVSSALTLTINGILTVAEAACTVDEKDVGVSVELIESNDMAQNFILAFCRHIELLIEDYSRYISLRYREV